MSNKQENPTITILLAFFNEKKYLSKAISSVISQTYPKWELILLDDGSTEQNQKIVLKYLKLDKRIKYKRFKVNKGKGNVLNYGLAKAKGEYILELDADDWLNKNALSNFLVHAKKAKLDIALIYSDYVAVFGKKFVNKQGRAFINRIDWVNNFFIPIPRFYRKSALIEVGGWPNDYPAGGKLYEDIALIFKLLNKYKMDYLKKKTIYVQARLDSITYRNRSAWYPIYKYLLAKSLKEWKEDYKVKQKDNNDIILVPKTNKPENEIKVSTLIHYQNDEIYLPYVIQSLIQQNHSNIELIFINDHSKDSSTLVINTILKNSRVPYKIIELKNKNGAGEAFNEGLKLVKGECLLVINSREVLEPEAIETMVEVMRKNEKIKLVYGNKKLFSSYPTFKFLKKEDKKQITILERIITDLLPLSLYLVKTVEMKKDRFDVNYLTKGKYIPEWKLIYKLGQKGEFKHIPKELSFNLQGDEEQNKNNYYFPVKKVLSKKTL